MKKDNNGISPTLAEKSEWIKTKVIQPPISLLFILHSIDKDVCQTVDVAFNPLTIDYCRRAEAFKKMICEISIEAAAKQLKDPNETVSRDYKVLKKMNCKGGQPAAMPVRLGAKPADHDQPTKHVERNEDYTPQLYQEFVKQQSEYKANKPAEQKSAPAGNVVELTSKEFETIEEKPQDLEKDEEEEEQKLKRIVAPQYTITHSFGVEYADFLMSGPGKEKKIPKQLVIKIQVPRVVSLFAFLNDDKKKILI